MKDIYKQEEVEKLASEVVTLVAEKAKDQICDATYGVLSDYLYEHYTNNKEKIESELIASITEEYVKNPTDYKYKKLREKMFLENKDALTKVLTDEAIEQSVEDVIEQYTHRDYHFQWRWMDGIARIIIEKWDMFKHDERIASAFTRELERKNTQIEYLQEQLAEVRGIIE